MPTISVSRLSPITWGSKNSWELRFPISFTNVDTDIRPPEPFGNRWFPAITVNEPILDLKTFDLGNAGIYSSGFSFPQGTGLREIYITCYDTHDKALLKWFRDWVREDILNDGQYISTITKASRKLEIIQYNVKKEPIYRSAYKVFPFGTLDYEGLETSELITLSINFKITETISHWRN